MRILSRYRSGTPDPDTAAAMNMLAGQPTETAATSLPPEPLPEHDWRHDTVTSFPAIKGTDPPEWWTGPCPCGVQGCPDGPPLPMPADGRALLSCAPGVTSRMWRTRVANGQWENLPGLWDKAHASTHMPALDRQRAIRAALAASRHDIRAVLAQNPALLSDRVLGDGLRDMASRLEAGLEADRHPSSDEDETEVALWAPPWTAPTRT